MLREWAARARSIGKEIGKDIKAILASNLAQTRVEGSESTIKDLERTGGRTHTHIYVSQVGIDGRAALAGIPTET